MKRFPIPRAAVSAIAFAAILAACGGEDSGSALTADTPSVASTTAVTAGAPVAGVTPFISFVTLNGVPTDHLATLNFSIASQPGTVSRPVSVNYSRDYLQRRGYAVAGVSSVIVPVFGLYAGASNIVTMTLTYDDKSTTSSLLVIPAGPWVDPNATYDHVTAIQQRAPGSQLGFDFMYMKSNITTPVVLDSDGRVRWVGTGVNSSLASILTDNGFEVATVDTSQLYRIEFDGSVDSSAHLQAPFEIIGVFHNLELGKNAVLGNPDAVVDGQIQLESIVEEFEPDGTSLQTWDMGKIISDYMTANGDDASLFVRPGLDWFHMNTQIYDPSDDSLIVSSRENFVIKLDYATGAIRWIFGDPTKYWYTFPSLRAKALTLVGDGLQPLGQHALSIAPDGSLLMFNNGSPSTNQPAGAPAGASRPYSAATDYTIDETARTVTQNWVFDYAQSRSSPICSSARQVDDGSLLVDYAYLDAGHFTDVVGVDASRQVVFTYRFANNPTSCNSSWNAQPINFDAMNFE